MLQNDLEDDYFIFVTTGIDAVEWGIFLFPLDEQNFKKIRGTTKNAKKRKIIGPALKLNRKYAMHLVAIYILNLIAEGK